MFAIIRYSKSNSNERVGRDKNALGLSLLKKSENEAFGRLIERYRSMQIHNPRVDLACTTPPIHIRIYTLKIRKHNLIHKPNAKCLTVSYSHRNSCITAWRITQILPNKTKWNHKKIVLSDPYVFCSKHLSDLKLAPTCVSVYKLIRHLFGKHLSKSSAHRTTNTHEPPAESRRFNG